MPFLQQRKRSFATPSVIGILVLMLVVLILVVVRPTWLEKLALNGATVTAGIRLAITDSAQSTEIGFTSKKHLAEKVQLLEEENTALRIRAALYDEVAAERDRLHDRFGRGTTTVGVIAHVIASPTRSPYDTLVLDVGSDKGIEIGDSVWFDATTLVAVVDQVSARGSRARLFSSSGQETNVFVGTSSPMLTAVGRGGGAFELQTPKDVIIAENDALMFSSGQFGVLGFVQKIVTRDGDPFQTVYAVAPINLFEMREVLVQPGTPR
jgi:cell shape-determining protein MreC